MSYNIKDVIYEGHNHWVLRVKNGFEVYKNGIAHSTRCAQIGWTGTKGIERAIAECKRRDNHEK